MRLYRDPDVPGRIDFDRELYKRVAEAVPKSKRTHEHVVPIRSGYAWPVKAGSVVRIVTVEGPQVCDLNLWSLNNPRERFWAARTRQLQGAHVTTFDRLWSCLPYLRPMVTITNDTLPPPPRQSSTYRPRAGRSTSTQPIAYRQTRSVPPYSKWPAARVPAARLNITPTTVGGPARCYPTGGRRSIHIV